VTEIAHHIDLNLAQELRDPEFRKEYFLAETSARIAEQLIALRKRRGLDQAEVANLVGTQQPAISRIERADYQSWSFNTLRKIAGALDARIRVEIEASEDVLGEYDQAESQLTEECAIQFFTNTAAAVPASYLLDTSIYLGTTLSEIDQFFTTSNLSNVQTGTQLVSLPYLLSSTSPFVPSTQTEAELRRQIAEQSEQIDRLKRAIKKLEDASLHARPQDFNTPPNFPWRERRQFRTQAGQILQ
jgi:transcriptional regulator with XRE-family HTH domain